ncbi:hypothetical protein [Pelagibius sp. Alg239-R121]|uniref:DUF7003 family protein n=1 Tax=Pelagibius sp. Alg239-R121 TaxID=2993448 RepID=UPI0024A79367|nr:hypothetical protein [Pelagibius sp. Alg239-R121]
MTIEIFGFSPRSGIPDTQIYSFSSKLSGRRTANDFVRHDAYDRFLAVNPFNESHVIFPVDEGDWQDLDDPEFVSKNGATVPLRGRAVPLPGKSAYADAGIRLEQPRVQTFELCRFLAHHHRDYVLARPEECRHHLDPALNLILTLEEWHHPDVADESLPSESPTFQQLAQVVETGDLKAYNPSQPPNTHWSFWPDGGTL